MAATSAPSPATESGSDAVARRAPSRLTGWLTVSLYSALAAALLVAAFDLLVAERVLDRAIEAERGGAGLGAVAAPELFSRTEQNVGLALGVLLVATGVGLVLAGVATLMTPASTHARRLWLGIAATGFWALAALPALKYPALPPGVESSLTIGERQLAFLALVAAGVAGALVGRWVKLRMEDRVKRERMALALTAGLVPAALALILLPEQRIIGSIDSSLLSEFRLVSLASQTIFWTALGAVGFLMLSPGRRVNRLAGKAPNHEQSERPGTP